MPPVHRKSAMRVRDGRVQKKNNWTPDPGDYYARAQSEIRIERVDPGPGYRHVVTVRQLREFIELLPDWDELAIGLEAISIWRGNSEWLGLSNPGVVVITAWPQDLWKVTHRRWLAEVADLLTALGVELADAPSGDPDFAEVRWTEPQARAFMLLDVLVHELGHHHDRMTTSGASAPRGEPYAMAYARRVQDEILPEYLARFAI
ncbi:hypothetical protein OJ997_31165 [Solirubrobacter phytolaccae]|uniref:Uncharacterized protein n=1 Tax=Solirubrobacter phytolaccae TaxID=1404360 RepID=A0A9X3SAT2_9ACTN|nr:hypothetical protein [Solirubrobacter phytolaccae]MDA0184804.1 hypothetical protein [Solirubrobacter phytolaccae]